MSSEGMAFSEAFDTGFVLQRDMENFVGHRVPLSMLTDSRSLFDIITTASAREPYGKLEISIIGLIRSELNTADAFIKAKKFEALEGLVRDGEMWHPVAEWAIRKYVLHPKCREATGSVTQKMLAF